MTVISGSEDAILLRPVSYFVILYTISSGWAIRSLWRQKPTLIRGILWSVIIAIPFLGPLFYAAFYSPPTPLPPNQRQGVHPYVALGGERIIDDEHGVEPKARTEPWFESGAIEEEQHKRPPRRRRRKRAEEG